MDFVWREAVARHGKRLRSVIRRMDQSADAEDIEQSCWLLALAKGKAPDGIWPWLVHVARRLVWREFRRRRARAMAAHSPWAAVYIATQQRRLEEEDAQTAALKLLSVATPEERRVVVCLYYMGLTRPEAAAQLGIAPTDVSNALERLRYRAASKAVIRDFGDLRLAIPESVDQPMTVWPPTWEEHVSDRMRKLTVRRAAAAGGARA